MKVESGWVGVGGSGVGVGGFGGGWVVVMVVLRQRGVLISEVFGGRVMVVE